MESHENCDGDRPKTETENVTADCLGSGLEKLKVDESKKVEADLEENVDVDTNNRHEKETVLRHCAFCLVTKPFKEMKYCEKCEKRIYCTAMCLKLDWPNASKGGRGQGHEDWCGHEAGEEDVDWKYVEGQGQSGRIVTLRDFPPLSRIIVERDETFYTCDPAPGVVCDQSNCMFKRCNVFPHDCDANCAAWSAGSGSILNSKGAIIYARRLIKKGEFLTINRTYYNETTTPMMKKMGFPLTTAANRAFLLKMYKITCPPDCFCRRLEIERQVTENRRLFASYTHGPEYSKVFNPMEDLRIAEALLKGSDTVHSTPHDKAAIYMVMNMVWKMLRNEEEADKVVKEARKMWAMCHPDSQMLVSLK